MKRKFTVVRLHEPQLSKVKSIKRDTGKSIERIVTEAIEAGIAIKEWR